MCNVNAYKTKMDNKSQQNNFFGHIIVEIFGIAITIHCKWLRDVSVTLSDKAWISSFPYVRPILSFKQSIFFHGQVGCLSNGSSCLL